MRRLMLSYLNGRDGPPMWTHLKGCKKKDREVASQIGAPLCFVPSGFRCRRCSLGGRARYSMAHGERQAVGDRGATWDYRPGLLPNTCRDAKKKKKKKKAQKKKKNTKK